MLKILERTIGAIGAITSIIYFIDNYILKSKIIKKLSIPASIPIWVLAIFLLFYSVLFFILSIKHNSKLKTEKEILYKIPSKTIIILPSQQRKDFWWHMGSHSNKPAMQIVGNFAVTNITKYNIYLVSIKMNKPFAKGNVLVKNSTSECYGSYEILPGGTTEITFDFWIVPPKKKENDTFKADIALIDQFGNEHWKKGIVFQYS